ncbi:MAG TPA: hypothetical protein VLW50_21910 [Streptosporangiaceae bacterium]|nr:hypothetical protein [Streptosporangiaceae bacterium]
MQDYGRRRTHTSTSVAGTLAVAAGYGLAVSVLMVATVERMFGAAGPTMRLAVLGTTVAVLVAGAAVARARRSWHGRRPGRG